MGILRKLIPDLQIFISDVLESKQQILKQYIIGMILIIFSSILITTTNFLVFLPKSYDLNPISPVNRHPVSIFDLKTNLWELARGYGFLKDSINVQGRILAYQVIIASVIARIYAINRSIPPKKIFQEGYIAFLLILISLILIVGSDSSDVFLEGKISWFVLFSTALGIFLTYEQLQQKRDPYHV